MNTVKLGSLEIAAVIVRERGRCLRVELKPQTVAQYHELVEFLGGEAMAYGKIALPLRNIPDLPRDVRARLEASGAV